MCRTLTVRLLRVHVVVVDKCLEVPHFNHLAFFAFVFDQRVDLQRLGCMLCQKFLNPHIVQQLILCQSKNLKCLLFCDESAFDPEAFFCDLLSAGVAILLCVGLVVLFAEVLEDLVQSLLLCQRADVPHRFSFLIMHGH